MKEYKLSAWPDLPPPYQRTAYRRLLSDMSHRYVPLRQLSECSGLARGETRHFLELLQSRGVLRSRNRLASDTLLAPLRPLGAWFRRAFAARRPL